MTVTIAGRLAAGLLAEGATTADRAAGPCALCRHGILRGDRHATLPGGKLAHLPCITTAARAPLVRIRTTPRIT